MGTGVGEVSPPAPFLPRRRDEGHHGRPPAPADRLASWQVALALTLLTRAVFLAVGWAAAWYFTAEGARPDPAGIFDIWNRWDAVLFQRVAEFGYTDPRTDPHATAFFPLFPLLLKGLHGVGLSWIAAGMLISTAATVVALAFLYRLAEEEIGTGAGRRAASYLAFFPTSVFLIAPYSEALFLAGAIPAFYYARRSRWPLTALAAAVAVGARAAGLFVLFGLAWEFVRTRDFRPINALNAVAALVTASLPLLAYAIYLARVKGSPFYFFTDQRLGWFREFTDPITSLRATWEAAASTGNAANWRFAWGVEILAAAAGVGFIVWALARKEWGYAAFMGTTLAALMTSTWYFSVPRMLLSFFPVMLLLASLTARRPRLHEYLLMATIPLATLGVVVFTRSAWFH